MFDSLYAMDLQGLTKNLITGWIGPVFLLAIACFAIMFLKDRSWTKLLGFIGMAALIGVLVYNASDWFGSTGKLSGVAKSQGNQITNAIHVDPAILHNVLHGITTLIS